MTDIQMVKGDFVVMDVLVTRLNSETGLDTPVDLTDAKVWFVAKEESAHTDVEAVININSEDNPDEIHVIDPENQGIIEISIIPSRTVDYPYKWLLYNVQVREVDGLISTVQSGYLELLKNVAISIL